MSGADTSHREYVRQLFNAHYLWLSARLSRYLNSSSYAEDIAADTFVQLLSTPQALDIREPRALLTTIAQRLIYQLWRRRDVERAFLMTLSSSDQDTAPSPETMVQLYQALDWVEHQLDNLPDKVKATFVLSRLNGKTYTQIAAQLGISLRSVSDYMNLAQSRCSKPDSTLLKSRPPKTREYV